MNEQRGEKVNGWGSLTGESVGGKESWQCCIDGMGGKKWLSENRRWVKVSSREPSPEWF